MLICFCRGRSTPAIRAMFLNPAFWLLALGSVAKSQEPKAKGDFLPLALFVFRVDADHPYHAFAVDDLALVANLLYRCSYLHNLLVLTTPPGFARPDSRWLSLHNSFIAVNNASAIQIIGRELDCDFIARQNADEILTHLP